MARYKTKPLRFYISLSHCEFTDIAFGGGGEGEGGFVLRKTENPHVAFGIVQLDKGRKRLLRICAAGNLLLCVCVWDGCIKICIEFIGWFFCILDFSIWNFEFVLWALVQIMMMTMMMIIFVRKRKWFDYNTVSVKY